ncbi:MAG: UPF0182 family protein [Acidimicrobiales bacterium]|nr:UPF0182 family protein [Acidimicrobiales bacterium]
MRAPTDMPRRLPRAPGRGRALLVIGAVVLFFLITSLRGIAGFYTDYLWFDSLGNADVWRGVLGAKVALALIFTGAFFLLLWVNLIIADRLAPPFRPTGPDEEFIERYHDVVGGRTGLVRAVTSVVLALIAGAGVSSEWNSWILFTHGADFGVDDPQYGTDIGFYVFKLPFLSFVSGWLFAALLIVLIVTAVFHYLNGGIRVSSVGERVTPQVKAHLSVLLGLLALVKAGGYWLQRYDLVLSERGYVDGAGYTDIKAQLPAINLLLLISVASFVLFIVNIWRRGWTLPILGVGLWALVAVVAGAIYPQFVQRFQVNPNEPEREEPYIARNIDATREAMGLSDDDIEISEFDLNVDKDSIDLEANAESVRNIRIWDPSSEVLGKTFPQLQRTRDYYRVNDVDIDRYDIDGRPTQVVLSVRDLNSDNVPQKSWAGEHLAYTHGYGVIVAPANAKEPSGEPTFVARDVPYDTDEASLQLEEESVYFGEELSSYVVVGSKVREIHYQGEEGTEFTEYEGDDGVQLDNVVKRAAFALRFGAPNLLISSQISSRSEILYIRDVRERAETLAPFLHFDADPYPVVVDGRIKWMLDAYTTTNRYPYGQSANTEQLTAGSGLRHDFNYVRNSVKTVVDAYDGTVDFYVMDVEDPIIDAYRDAFPKLFKDFEDMPENLQEHLRYPEDLFRVQTNMWGDYHIDEADEFYSGDDRWDVARDPGTAGAAAATRTTDASGATVSSRSARIDPYYLFTQLPGSDAPEFILLRPFVPTATRDDNQLLTAFMVGKSDGADYGKLQVFVMPRGDLPNGPALVQGDIQSDTEVSREESLLSGAGSSVSYGSLSAIPISNGLVYVRPFYVTSTQTEVPALQKVIVSFEGDVKIRDTLQEALAAVFGEAPPTLEESAGETPTDPNAPPADEEPEPTGTVAEQVSRLLVEANDLFDQADEALAQRDLARYETLTNQGRVKTADAERLLEEAGVGATTTTSAGAQA